MQVATCAILDRSRKGMSGIASLQDFTYNESGTIPIQYVIEQPSFSLYCLDDAGKQAVFVELPPGINLPAAPFFYQAQFENALRLVMIPYDKLPNLASGPPIDHLILVHNIGRCGSTLLHHAFNELDTVVSLSEPDALGNFVTMRQRDNHRDAALIDLLGICMKLIVSPYLHPPATTGAVKFRNQGVQIMSLMMAVFPHAHHLFMYRNAVDWIASIYRLVTRHRAPPVLSRDEAVSQMQYYLGLNAAEAEAAFDVTFTRISLVEFLAVEWQLLLERYQACYGSAVPIMAVRYEDLVDSPPQILEALFRYCDLPGSQVEAALRAFSRDSQEGTKLQRETGTAGNSQSLSHEHLSQIEAILARHPFINTPDYVLPGTLRL